MQLSISIPLSVISRYISENYTGILYSGVTTDWTGGDTHIEVRKIGEAILSARQNRLLVAMPLEVVLDIRKNDLDIINLFKSIGGLKQIRFSIRVSFLFRPTWADGWTLDLVTEPEFEWIAKPRIASVLKMSIAAWIGPAIRQAIRKQADTISTRIVEAISLEEQVPLIWTSIQQPILVNEDHQVWLNLIPGQVIHRTEIQCSPDHLRMMLELSGNSRLTFNRPQRRTIARLPVVTTSFTIPQNSLSMLDWEAELPLRWLNERLEGFQKVFVSLDQLKIKADGEQLVTEAILQFGPRRMNIKRPVKALIALSADSYPQHLKAKVIRLELPALMGWMEAFLSRKIDTLLNRLIHHQAEALVREVESSLVNQSVGDAWILSVAEPKPVVSKVMIKSESVHISGELYGKVGLRLDRL